MDFISQIKKYVSEHEQQFIAGLLQFLSQPSVSTTGQGINETVTFLKDQLKRLGFEARILKIGSANPVVYGERGGSDASSCICIYGHYDVQDPDPLSEWLSDPFKPEIRNGLIFARGATDDKGNLFANLKAAETIYSIFPELPLRLKFFFEGEEEIGSPHLRSYLKQFSDLLEAEATILCDRGVHETGRPQIYLGNKGLVSVKVCCRRAIRDVHSGHAPLIPSSAWDLIRMLDSLKDPKGKIRIPGYYDRVAPPTDQELRLLRTIPFDPAQFRQRYGVSKTLAEGSGIDFLKKLLFEPTANISGLKAGWMGGQPKTIIPREALAYLDFRLVRDQTASEAVDQITHVIDDSPFGPFDADISPRFDEYRCNPTDRWVRLAMKAARDVTGKEPVVWPLLDGSGPLYWFHQYLGGPTFIIGLGAPFETANTHAPNENIGIDNYLTGIAQMAVLLYRATKLHEDL